MTIYIAHLYYDLLNLYGELGNIKVIQKLLNDQKIKVIIDNLTINDEIDFNKYDLIYIGSGTESNQLIALKDILKYKTDLKDYIESGKFIISTGNSYELFGQYIIDKDDKYECLETFEYNAKRIDKRIVGDSIAKCKLISSNIIGFQNQGSIIENNAKPLFNIIKGYGKEDGINYKNFYGTYFLGPILARNPELTKYIITKLIKNKDSKYKLKKFDLEFDTKAKEIYMNTYHR